MTSLKSDVHKGNFSIKVKGKELDEGIMNNLYQALVETSLHMPGMFWLEFHDENLEIFNKANFQAKDKVEISGIAKNGSASDVLISGEITDIEMYFDKDGDTKVIIRGYDQLYHLHNGRQTRTFLKAKDSEVVQKIASEAGLGTSKIKTTGSVQEYIIQWNQSNMEFLFYLAERNGYVVYVDEKNNLYFDSLPTESGLTVEWKRHSSTQSKETSLTYFNPRITTSHQVKKVTVRGWDPKTKKEVVGQISSPVKNAIPEVPGKSVEKSRYKKTDEFVVTYPVDNATVAKDIAQGIMDQIASELIQANGICVGYPQMKAGLVVDVKGVNDKFNGKYLVTTAKHIWGNGQDYETHFEVSGSKRQTFSNLLSTNGNHNGYGPKQGLMPGFMIGLVTNLDDPDKMGRIKVKYPALHDSEESAWVRVVSLMAGANRGWVHLPQINDEVLIGFEQGDIHRPYMLGMLFNGKDKRPEPEGSPVKDGKTEQYIFQSKSGHYFVFNDENSKEKITLKSKSGHKILLDDASGKENIIIVDKSGKNQIKIDSAKNELTITVEGDMKVKTKGKVSIDAKANVEIKSSASMKLQASSNIDIKASGQVNIKGASINLN